MKPFLLLILSCALALNAEAGSATWTLNPASNNWNQATNWTPATVPNGSADTATFGVSNISPSIRDFIDVDSVVFSSGASAFTIAVDPDPTTGHSASLSFDGVGIVNNSGITQAFSLPTGAFSAGSMVFTGNSTAGNQTTFLNNGGNNEAGAAEIFFMDDSNAGSGTFTNTAGSTFGGDLEFFDNSSAADGIFTCQGGAVSGFGGGVIAFWDNATAGSGTFFAQGATARNAGAGFITFFSGSPTAADATLTATGGTGGGDGGVISFHAESDGGRSRVKVLGNGTLKLEFLTVPSLKIGSLEGDGVVALGSHNLAVGSNNSSTTFDGSIGGSGSLIKIGTGRLVLTKPNTYTGRTRIKRGVLQLDDQSGAIILATSHVAVEGGTLAGRGAIAGSVTVGTGTGRGGILEARGSYLTVNKSLLFKSDSTYQSDLNSSAGFYSIVQARSVTIEEGALFTLPDSGDGDLGAIHIVVINNLGSAPINGTFANLPDGGTIVVGQNTFHANYNGGDGNDLELTTDP